MHYRRISAINRKKLVHKPSEARSRRPCENRQHGRQPRASLCLPGNMKVQNSKGLNMFNERSKHLYIESLGHSQLYGLHGLRSTRRQRSTSTLRRILLPGPHSGCALDASAPCRHHRHCHPCALPSHHSSRASWAGSVSFSSRKGRGQFFLGGGTVFPRYMYPRCIVQCIQPQHTAIHARDVSRPGNTTAIHARYVQYIALRTPKFGIQRDTLGYTWIHMYCERIATGYICIHTVSIRIPYVLCMYCACIHVVLHECLPHAPQYM